MNETTKINSFVVNQFDSDDLVNTISIVETGVISMENENIFPLVNIDLLNVPIEDDVLLYNFRITILQQRDINPSERDTKLLSDSNYLDNINETVSIAQRFINVLARQNNDYNIEIQSQTSLTVLKDWRGHGCDGVQFDIELSIPNEGLSC